MSRSLQIQPEFTMQSKPSKTPAPYGSWKSPITTDLIVAGAVRLGDLDVDGKDVYWVEGRSSEGGRSVISARTPDGVTRDVTPEGFDVRTRVHEYGGGAFTVCGGTVYFSRVPDNRLYRQEVGAVPEPVTPESDRQYADLEVDSRRNRLICVMEEPGENEAVNTLVSVDLESGTTEVLMSGSDFYATPRLNPDSTRLAWISWNHSDMPWDASEVWTADVDEAGALKNARRVAGGYTESVFQPGWSPEGDLVFVSDRTGWWNLYRLQENGPEPLCPMEAEFGLPQWVFKMSTYAFISPSTMACTYTREGIWRLALLDIHTREFTPLETPCTSITGLRGGDGFVAFTAGFPDQPDAQVRLDISSNHLEILRPSSRIRIDPDSISPAVPVAYPTEGGRTAHAFLYRPRNRDHHAPEEERPPLLVMIHGGPTAATAGVFNLKIQFWTSRGFAVLDVNYGGSTGFGRLYREVLNGNWGVVDVDDCVSGARYLVDRGEVDGNRLAITGGSAGGYTALAALTFRNVFTAGASHYGVSNLEALTEETHKFESRYLDRLVGPYPEKRDLYLERSPLHHVKRLSCPVIFFQGLDDKVVPPNQSERMAEALRERGIPVALVTFAGEEHGFRKADSIKRAYEGELYFYSRIFGFDPADTIEPVDIDNLHPGV